MYFERNIKFSLVSFCLLFLVICIAYSNTFNVPFLFDDTTSIVDKQDLYLDSFSSLYQQFGHRIVVYLTFKLNFELHQLNVWGYHLVNICIHLICAFLVYLFTLELLKAHTNIQQSNSIEANNPQVLNIHWFALFVCLIFALHPLQTQAVTYIVQRTTSLAALFYIATMLSYLKFRTAKHLTQQLIAVLLTGICFVLAILTKQSTYTLPFALLLLEIVFIYPILRYSIRLPVIFGSCFAAVVIAGFFLYPDILAKIDAASKETLDFSRLAYFETQLSVLLHYVKLFIYPAQLQVEYIYPLSDGNLWDSSGYLIGYACVVGFAIFNIRKSPLIAYSLLFFFIAHGVESSFIPISDLVFEHRTYLPNLSLCLLFVYLIFKLFSNKVLYIKYLALLLVALLIFLTFQRNALWNSPEKLYRNELLINNKKPRIYAMLGEFYGSKELNTLSADNYKLAYNTTGNFDDLDNQGFDAKFGYFNNYVAALSKAGENQLAIDQTLAILPKLKDNKYLAIIYTNLGSFYWQEKNYLHCTKYMFQAMKLKPASIEPVIGVGKCFEEMGDKEMAVQMFNKARKMIAKQRQ